MNDIVVEHCIYTQLRCGDVTMITHETGPYRRSQTNRTDVVPGTDLGKRPSQQSLLAHQHSNDFSRLYKFADFAYAVVLCVFVCFFLCWFVCVV